MIMNRVILRSSCASEIPFSSRRFRRWEWSTWRGSVTISAFGEYGGTIELGVVSDAVSIFSNLYTWLLGMPLLRHRVLPNFPIVYLGKISNAYQWHILLERKLKVRITRITREHPEISVIHRVGWAGRRIADQRGGFASDCGWVQLNKNHNRTPKFGWTWTVTVTLWINSTVPKLLQMTAIEIGRKMAKSYQFCGIW